MNNNIQGLIACSGNATRFAQSIGKNPPYPKHLEMIGDKSVLNMVTESFIKYIPVSSITFTINSQLQDQYISHLKNIQEKLPNIKLSFVVTTPGENSNIYTDLKNAVKNDIFQLNGKKLKLPEDPIMAIGYGDAIIKIAKAKSIQKAIESYLPKLETGHNISIFNHANTPTQALHYITKPSSFSEKWPTKIIEAYKYGFECWNINTIGQLRQAREDLS